MSTILKIKNLQKKFGDLDVLKNINFKINKGEIKCLVGRSGCGKTTLLRCLSLLERFEEGEVIFGDRVINSESNESEKKDIRKNIGIVFQDFNLWPHLTVGQNIIDPLILIKKVSLKQAKETAFLMLKKVGMEDKFNMYPDFLSGGQKQRVAIARALAMKPEILLFDEITSSLDPELVSGILKLLKRLAIEGQTMIVVTHHIEFAREIADNIVFLDKGRIVEEGAPNKIIHETKNKEIKVFLKDLKSHDQEINVYEGEENFRAFNIGFMKKARSGGDYMVLGAAKEDWWTCMGNDQFEWNKIRKEKKINLKMIIYELVNSEKNILQEMPELTEYRIYPKDTSVPSNVNIYDDTVLILIFDKIPTVIEIRNKKVVEGYVNYFNILWEHGEKVKLKENGESL